MAKATRSGASTRLGRQTVRQRFGGRDFELIGPDSDVHIGGDLNVQGNVNGFPMTVPATRLDRAVRTTSVTINAIAIGDAEPISQTVVTVPDTESEVLLRGHAHVTGSLAQKSVILGIIPVGGALAASLEEAHSETSANVAIPRLLLPEASLPPHSAGTYQLYLSTLDFTGLNMTVTCASAPPRHAWLEAWALGVPE